MAEPKSNRFTKYVPLLLDALRSVDPNPMRPAEATAWIRARQAVPTDDLTRVIQNGTQTIFENDVHWARFYLVKAGLISKAKRGFWSLTPEGRQSYLTPEETWNLYVRVRDSNRPGSTRLEEDTPAPDIADESEENPRSYWFVGAVWNKTDDQLPRFREQGIWENGYTDKFLDLVRRIRLGDRVAVKVSFATKLVPFDVGGMSVSAMRIKATGTVLENISDGRTVRIAWDPPVEPRDWYFYTYRNTIVQVDAESEGGRRLIDFTFRGIPQDYDWFLAEPYWREKYGAKSEQIAGGTAATAEPGEVEFQEDEFSYTVDQIIDEGCFLTRDQLIEILERWFSKKNLILQGPPGTGKTWLAKRLGFALAGSNDRDTARSRLRVVQFHPSLAYEDFVRGWRPNGDGRLQLIDGILMQAIQAAESEPDRPFVLVIEEINRGNPAQIFGEMLTLLEGSKRQRSEAIELAYRKEPGERVHVPANLYVVGTMNIADRSLAIVDLALRRRFAFVDLRPTFGEPWRVWCRKRGLEDSLLAEIENRIDALNVEISTATSLGPQFQIGHSYITPDIDAPMITDGPAWFRARIETEIGPLLEEYWYDSPDVAKTARKKLLVGLG